MGVKDLNEPQAMNKGLLEHIAVLAAVESIAIDLKYIIHVLNLDTSLVDDQDDLAQTVFAAVKRPVGQHHIPLLVLVYQYLKRHFLLRLNWWVMSIEI